MYDIETVKEDLSKWIIETLSVEHPAFEGMPPCPFAQKALLAGRIDVILADITTDLSDAGALLADGKDVVAYVFDPELITPSDLTALTLKYKESYPDLMFLEDHPKEVEKVQDFICNQGKYACIFAAERNGVYSARTFLQGTDYYKNWDEDYKQAVWSR